MQNGASPTTRQPRRQFFKEIKMILSKLILAATMSATVLWLAPIQGDGHHPAHEQCACGHGHCDADCGVDCGHGHCGTDCDHKDADHAASTAASPDAHVGHSAVLDKKEKCDVCGGKGKVECGGCDGKGKRHFTRTITVSCTKCTGSGKVEYMGPGGQIRKKDCPDCKGTGTESKRVQTTETCTFCNGKGKLECPRCNGTGKKN